jgi:sec-independent protein translocase protein TatB
MLDVGFSEILLTSAIALIVLGPERLPKVARQVGNWMGRARAMARQLSEQLEREVSAEELLKEQFKSTVKPSTSSTRTANDPVSFDASHTPAIPPAPAEAAPPAASSPDTYSPEAAAMPHGADWQVSPPDAKTGNG